MSKPPARKVERQIKLPLSKAVEIAWKSIRMRMSRSLVVTSGIILAMAFLMYILCSDYTVESMRRWSNVAPQTAEFKAAQAKAQEIQPKVKDAFDQLIEASVDTKEATGTFDEKKVFGKEFSQIQRELGAMPIAPDAAKKLLAARPEMVPVMEQWIVSTRELRKAKAVLNGPQTLTALMKANGVPTAEKDILNSKMQTNWMIDLALLVAFVGILNAMLMSVTERFREIGTMKCLGALSSFIRRIFFLESAFIGLVGGVIGVVLGALITIIGYGVSYGFPLVFGGADWGRLAVLLVLGIVASVVLAVGAAIYPATVASRMRPANALRSSV